MKILQKIEEEGADKKGFDLEALRRFLDKGLPKPEEGDYAELVDEADPSSDVIIRRKNGTPVMQMAVETWEALRKQACSAAPPDVVD